MSYTKALTIDETRSARGEFRAAGTDLQDRLHSGIAKRGIVDITDIPGLDAIEVSSHGCSIGALVTVEQVGAHAAIRSQYPALAIPAQTLATPQIRHRATMGGALCQRTRCWYYRHPDLACPKKGDSCACPARNGNNHYGVCYDFGPCVYPHPSSIALALMTYDAKIEIADQDPVSVFSFYGDGSDVTRDHMLEPGQIVTGVRLPPPVANEHAFYLRQMSRAAAEWPLVEVIVRVAVEGGIIQLAKVGIGSVANVPFRLTEVEEALVGQSATPDVLAAAAALATRRANPSPHTAYKIPMITGCVLTALEEALIVALKAPNASSSPLTAPTDPPNSAKSI